VMRWRRGNQKWVLIGSGLESEDKAAFKRFAALTGAKAVDKWDDAVTHVICGLDSQRAAK